MSIYDSLAPGSRVAEMCLQKHAHAHADTHVHAQVRAHAINSYPCNILLWSCPMAMALRRSKFIIVEIFAVMQTAYLFFRKLVTGNTWNYKFTAA